MAQVEGATSIRVLLADDHELVRIGLRRFLERAGRISVVGEAGTMAEAISLAESLKPDVVLLDVRLPDGSGIEACRTIRCRLPEVRVIILTSYSDEQVMYDAILAGAAAFLLKEARGSDVAVAIDAVHRGQSMLDPGLTADVLDRLRTGRAPIGTTPLARLSEQERRMLAWISTGKTNREIAAEARLSETTVKHYVSNVLAKLDVTHRSEAAAIWARHQAGQAYLS